MSGPRPLEFDIGVQLASIMDKQGFEDVQHDAEGEDRSGAAPLERHHFYGFWGRALDPVVQPATPGEQASGQPDPSKGAQVLTAYEGSQGHAWTMEDPRVMPVVPTPEQGCGIFYGVNPTAGANGDMLGVCFVRTHANGKVTRATTTTGGAPDGYAIWDEVSPTGFVRNCPWGREIFGVFQETPDSPAVFTGYSLQAVGSTMQFSNVGGLPAPAAALSAGWSVQSGRIRLCAGVVSIGSALTPKFPVVQATPFVAIMTAVATAHTQAAAAFSAAATRATALAAAMSALAADPGLDGATHTACTAAAGAATAEATAATQAAAGATAAATSCGTLMETCSTKSVACG